MDKTIIFLILGLILLLVSGKYLVESSVAIARHFKIPTIIIGLTIVSFGTSAPELLVSLQAALQGHPEMAIGNVIGSNISNIISNTAGNVSSLQQDAGDARASGFINTANAITGASSNLSSRCVKYLFISISSVNLFFNASLIANI